MGKVADDIAAGLEDALAFARGDKSRAREYVVRVPAKVDIRRIRRRLRLTQSAFARRFGFELSSVRNWEQGRRTPEGPARILLRIIEREPDAVHRALGG